MGTKRTATVEKTCPECGRVFELRFPSDSRKKTCSRACYHRSRSFQSSTRRQQIAADVAAKKPATHFKLPRHFEGDNFSSKPTAARPPDSHRTPAEDIAWARQRRREAST